MLGISIVLFKSNSFSEINLIFIYFSSKSSEFLLIDPIRSLIMLQSFSYFLIFYLISLVGVKYLFPLISSKYSLTLLKTRYIKDLHY